jgi:hypothetical protein
VLEGHEYPLILYNESKHNIVVLIIGKANKIWWHFYYLLFAPWFLHSDDNRGPCFFNECALRRIRIPTFLHLRNDSERVRILYVWLSAKYSYTRRLCLRTDSRLVRHVVTYSNTFSSRTYWFSSCVRMARCDVFVWSSWRTYDSRSVALVYVWQAATYIYSYLHVVFLHGAFPLVCVWIIATYSYTLLHVRIYSMRLPLCVRIFLHAYSSSSVCFLASLFYPDIAIAVSLSSSSHWNSLRSFCSTFVATPPPF